MIASDDLADLDSQIVSLVRQCWEERHMPLLLSRLGGQDGGRIARETTKHAGSLKDYLVERLATDVRLVRHSTTPALIGAVPADEEAGVTDDFDTLLDRARSRTEEIVPRFQPAFWTAFRKPLEESKRRYMSIQPPIHFRDVLPEDRLLDFVEVERAYVVGPDAEAGKVLQKVQEWLEKNNLESTLFLLESKAGTTHLPSDDLLGRFLLALEPDDLKRISMPLDIVKKLRRQPL